MVQLDKIKNYQLKLEDEILYDESLNRSYLSNEKIHWKQQIYKVEEDMGEKYYELLAGALQRKNDPPVTLKSATEMK